MDFSSGHIPELAFLEDLESLAIRYRHRFGISPFDVSHWDSSSIYKSSLGRIVDLPMPPDIFGYFFTYSIEERQELIRSLEQDLDVTGGMVTSNGTIAILHISLFLKSIGVSRVAVLCPTYFSIFHCLRMLGIQYESIYLERPYDNLRTSNASAPTCHTALWITNPLYCTSAYLNDLIPPLADLYSDAGAHVIVDECLAEPGKEYIRKYANNHRVIGIYEPHKCLCVNGMKFALVTFSSQYQDWFDSTADIISGGLSSSSVLAVRHYLGENFQMCLAHARTLISETMQFLKKMIQVHPRIELDHNVTGCFVTCYCPRIPVSCSSDSDFLWSLFEQTGAAIIPGIRNHFSPGIGFCFRVNLTRDCPQFRAALKRLFSWLSQF